MDRICENRFCRTLNTNDAISDENKRPGRMNSGLMKVSGTESLPSLFSPDRSSRGTGGNRFSAFSPPPVSLVARRQKGAKDKTSECERERCLTATGRLACKPHSFVCIVVKCCLIQMHMDPNSELQTQQGTKWASKRRERDLGGQTRCFSPLAKIKPI